MAIYTVGISAYYHDSAAALLKDGEIVAAAQEERFTRIKHDPSFPSKALSYCLDSQGINIRQVSQFVYYEKPLLTFTRLIATSLGTAPRGIKPFVASMRLWLTRKLFTHRLIQEELSHFVDEETKLPKFRPNLLYSEHHLSHASAAFYPSSFHEAAILCMDGVGEWATTSAWVGKGNKLRKLWQINFPHSLGLFYSAFTSYCGFRVNSGEYKLMGLAPYGEPIYVDKIKEELIDIKPDGTFRLNLKYFKFHRGFSMTSTEFHDLFGQKPRIAETEISQFHMDMAASIQKVTEEIVLKLARSLRYETGLKNLCLSGGVALNCVANGQLLRESIFDEIWIQPASGDAGSAVGAALIGWHEFAGEPRHIFSNDSMKGTYLGPKFSNNDIGKFLKSLKASSHFYSDDSIFDLIALELDAGKVIGWFNGRMEFGPRSLGGRSIIGDPRNKQMQKKMNLKIKYRESFRPFAPSVLEEDVNSQFDFAKPSPYMLLVYPVKKSLCRQMTDYENSLFGIDKLNVNRSTLPAITHVDFSARVQTVTKDKNLRFYKLIRAFKARTGCPTIVNTSFNVRGEPIVCSPEDAYRCFMRTEMDILILENFVLYKHEQPPLPKDQSWMQEFALD